MSRTSEPDFEPGTLNPQTICGDEIKPGDRFGYKIVAVVGARGTDWAAYSGPTSWSDAEVASVGDKLSESVAMELFPTLARSLTYRR